MYRLNRDGSTTCTPHAKTLQILARDLKPGDMMWNAGIATWYTVDSVAGPDRYGKMSVTIQTFGYKFRLAADAVRLVKVTG